MSLPAIEVVFSFDTTGSMYPCLAEVRRKVKATVSRLFKDIPGIRVGVIAHGDYCDEGHSYLIKTFDLSMDEGAICRFVGNVGPTGGGDAPEAYEVVLHRARGLSWSPGAQRVLVLIGDDVPHGPSYPQNRAKLNWRTETDRLLDQGVTVYAVQALNRRHATAFYRELAERGGGFHLPLNQFAHVHELILAVCARQQGDVKLQQLEDEVVASGRMNRGVSRIFDTLLGREASRFGRAAGESAAEGRFQVLEVDSDSDIRGFVEMMGLTFKKGRGFYQFTKATTVQPYKEILMIDRSTGDIFTNEVARRKLGITAPGNVRVSPSVFDKGRYDVFIQSTSVNRKLIGGTRFLYELDDWAA